MLLTFVYFADAHFLFEISRKVPHVVFSPNYSQKEKKLKEHFDVLSKSGTRKNCNNDIYLTRYFISGNVKLITLVASGS